MKVGRYFFLLLFLFVLFLYFCLFPFYFFIFWPWIMKSVHPVLRHLWCMEKYSFKTLPLPFQQHCKGCHCYLLVWLNSSLFTSGLWTPPSQKLVTQAMGWASKLVPDSPFYWVMGKTQTVHAINLRHPVIFENTDGIFNGNREFKEKIMHKEWNHSQLLGNLIATPLLDSWVTDHLISEPWFFPGFFSTMGSK